MRKSIRRTRHRKKSVSDKYSRKSRITKTARNKNRSRNHKKSRKQMYVGGGCGASSAAGGVRPKEVTDWWYQSDEPDCHGLYTWIQMGPNETFEMNKRYRMWESIHTPANAMGYQGFTLTMIDSYEGETGGYGHKVGISFPRMEMTDTTTRITKKIISSERTIFVKPTPPAPIDTPPFIKPVVVQPSFDAFEQPLVSPVQYPQGSAASSPLTTADNVTWLWQSDDGESWNNFYPDDSRFLENAYQNPMRQPIMHPTRPWKFEFNVPPPSPPMRQTNTNTGSKRVIYRQVIPATVLP